jgi:hypothetical protein
MLGDVRDGAARACFDEALDVLVHGRPKVSLADAMEGAISVQIPAYGVCVESHKDNVPHGIWDNAQVHVLLVVGEDLLHIKNAILGVEEASARRVAIDEVEGVHPFLVLRYAGVGDNVQEELGLGVIFQRLGPGLVVREAQNYGAIDKQWYLGNRRRRTRAFRIMQLKADCPNFIKALEECVEEDDGCARRDTPI